MISGASKTMTMTRGQKIWLYSIIAVVVILALVLGLYFGLKPKADATPASGPGTSSDSKLAVQALQNIRNMGSLYNSAKPKRISLAGLGEEGSTNTLTGVTANDAVVTAPYAPGIVPNAPMPSSPAAADSPASSDEDEKHSGHEGSDSDEEDDGKETFIDGETAREMMRRQVDVVIIVVSPTCGACRNIRGTLAGLKHRRALTKRDHVVLMPTSELHKVKDTFDVQSVPHLFKLKAGKKVAETVGSLPDKELVQFVRS